MLETTGTQYTPSFMSECTALLNQKHGSQKWFGHWLQLMCCAYLLLVSEYFRYQKSRPSEVDLRQSLALIDMSVEFRLKLECSGSTETEFGSLQSDFWVTKGRVDNENNSQSWYLNMSNTYMSESLIYGIKDIARSWGYQKCKQQCDVTGIWDSG